ncbi:MAG: ABC transporter permease, partial [Bdellovibrionales bacterium]|nr:ABC transporter permease [Bdellovibrionales bacterium]
MKPSLVVAINTFREIIRDRVLYGLLIFALLLIGLSLVLGELSFAEQSRISMNFGLVGIHLSAFTLSVFIGSTLVSREIEKQTVLTLLVRPVSRMQFLLGKFFGLMMVTSVVILGLAASLAALALFLQWPIGASFGIALVGILFESFVILSITMFFGMISKPTLAVSCAVGFFLIGHWVNDLVFFAEKGSSEVFRYFAKFVYYVVPDLERFNWRSFVIYNDFL